MTETRVGLGPAANVPLMHVWTHMCVCVGWARNHASELEGRDSTKKSKLSNSKTHSQIRGVCVCVGTKKSPTTPAKLEGMFCFVLCDFFSSLLSSFRRMLEGG